MLKSDTNVADSIAKTKLIPKFARQKPFWFMTSLIMKVNKYLIVALFILAPFALFSQNWDLEYSDLENRRDSVFAPYINPYILPVVFDGKFPSDIFFNLPFFAEEKDQFSFVLEPIQLQLEEKLFIDTLRRRAYQNLIRNDIKLVKYVESDLPKAIEKTAEIKPNIFQQLFEIGYVPELEKGDKIETYKPKRVYWTKNGSSLLQFSQNYISDNWYSGGIGNLNLLSVQNFTFNYKKKSTQFNSFLEWKLSFYTNPNDTVRNFRIGEDLIRSYSDFGIRAFNDKWSYSTNLEIKTQLFRNHRENTKNEIISSILSPVMINMGILGMKYQLNKMYENNKYKKLNFSVDISPLSVQYTYVVNEDVDPTRFGIKEGETFLLDLGSTINSKITVNFNRQVSFSSRLKIFTNYEKTIVESENELNMSLSRFFSTRFYLYSRFDDSPGLKKDPNVGYLQTNELFSFGFNYKW